MLGVNPNVNYIYSRLIDVVASLSKWLIASLPLFKPVSRILLQYTTSFVSTIAKIAILIIDTKHLIRQHGVIIRNLNQKDLRDRYESHNRKSDSDKGDNVVK